MSALPKCPSLPRCLYFPFIDYPNVHCLLAPIQVKFILIIFFPNPDEKDLQSEVMEYDYLSYFRPDILIAANYLWEILSPDMEKLPSGLWKIDTIFGSCLTCCGKVRRESPDPDDPFTKIFDKLWDEAKIDADSASEAHPKTKKLVNRTRIKRRTRFRVGLHRGSRKHKHRLKRTHI